MRFDPVLSPRLLYFFFCKNAPDQSTGYKMFSLNGSHDVYAYVYQNIWEWGNAGRAYNLANNGYKVGYLGGQVT